MKGQRPGTVEVNHFFKTGLHSALAGVAHWIESCPATRKVMGSIPSQGLCFGCMPGPQLGMCERQPINVSHIDLKKKEKRT